MTVEIPVDMAPFVARMISEQRYSTVEDVLAEGLRLLQVQETLRDELLKGVKQLDEGKRIPAHVVFSKAEEIISRIENEIV